MRAKTHGTGTAVQAGAVYAACRADFVKKGIFDA
jgi:hypothetical protein